MKNHLFKLLLIAFLILSVSSALTYAYKVISAEGTIKTKGADVSILIETDKEALFPGKDVKYKPVINYKGIDSYIRLKLDISNENLTSDMFSDLGSDWIKKGDYYYYKKIVKHNDFINSFDSFHIPNEWDSEMISKFDDSRFDITVLCDAIQATNFNPDFESETPWGNISILDSKYDGDNYTEDTENVEPLEISFSGNGNMMLSSNNLLSKSLLPGEKYKQKIKLKNTGKTDINIYFYSSKFEDEDDLLEKVILKLEKNGKKFYAGNLNGIELQKKQKLCVLKPGEKSILNYEINLPVELDNRYNSKNGNFIWNFTSFETEYANTADKNNMMFLSIIIATAFILLLFIKRRGIKNDV